MHTLFKLGCVVITALSAWAQSASRFVSVGNMSVARAGHTATLLANGKVLVAGGTTDKSPTAELYDPATRTFSSTGPMMAPRIGHAAALLKDGRVFIAGGGPGFGEIYDPSTGRFQMSGSGLLGFTAQIILIGDGKILIVSDTRNQLYDLFTGEVTSLPPSGVLFPQAALLLADGRVLILGQDRLGNNASTLYDPSTGAFNPTGVLSGAIATSPLALPENSLAFFSYALLPNGLVLVAGGEDFDPNCTYLDTRQTAEVYDPFTGRFSFTGSLTTPRGEPVATALAGGQVLVSGGGSADLYDTASGSFTALGPMSVVRTLHTSTLLADGTVLMAGGSTSVDNRNVTELSSAELYIPSNRTESSASLSASVAADSLVSVVGSGLTTATAAATNLQPPPQSLGGVSVRVRDGAGDVMAPLLYVSPSQINFELPAGPGGIAAIDILSGGNTVSLSTNVQGVAPGLFAFPTGAAASYAVRAEPDGTQTVLPPGAPIVLDDRPVVLVVYATGVRNRSSLGNVSATIGKVTVPVTYAGPAGDGVPGLDQVNLALTSALKNNTDGHLILRVDGVTSNAVVVSVR